MPPVGPAHELPPGGPVFRIDRAGWLHERERPCVNHLWERTRILRGVRRDLSECRVAGRIHEPGEAPVGDRIAVHPEPVHRDAVHGAFFRIVLVRSHAERAAWNPDHVRERRRTRRVLRARFRRGLRRQLRSIHDARLDHGRQSSGPHRRGLLDLGPIGVAVKGTAKPVPHIRQKDELRFREPRTRTPAPRARERHRVWPRRVATSSGRAR